jgi:hypothetical protein
MAPEWWLVWLLWAEDGSLGLFFQAPFGVWAVAHGMDDKEGMVGDVVAGLFSIVVSVDLPLTTITFASLLTPLTRGHWCCLAALYVMNLHLQALHSCWEQPLVASSAILWWSHLDVQFLLQARCFFSF